MRETAGIRYGVKARWVLAAPFCVLAIVLFCVLSRPSHAEEITLQALIAEAL